VPPTVKSLRITPKTPEEIRKADRAVQSLAGTSRRQTVGLFEQNCVWLNGKLCTAPWQRLEIGDTVELRYQADQRYAPKKKPPRHLPFKILFEDDDLIVVDKPAHWLTVPTHRKEKDTLVQRVTDYLTKQRRGRTTWALAVHRLDRGVSGAIVFAKTVEAQRRFRKQLEMRHPEREYLAIVAGRMTEKSGTFRSYLVSGERFKQHSTDDAEAGKLAVTHYEVEDYAAGATIVRVKLETGRRNQIRVHFAEAGHPVLGDAMYEPARAKHRRWKAKRLALHARLLAFDHPITGRKMRFEVPMPEEFEQFIHGE
jgi:23S rRNA pseudouridine1911/1915/1917 synthase